MARTPIPIAGKSIPSPRTRNGFQEPNLDWLKAQFSTTRIGAMKASELEIILAYQLMWKVGDLAKSPYYIARDYGYTEAKATRLLQEFACRFRENEDDAAFLARLWNCITGKDTSETDNAIVPVVQDTEIILSIQSPYDRNKLRDIIERKGLPWSGDFNKKLVRMPVFLFAYVFQNQNPDFADAIEKARKELAKKFRGANPSFSVITTHYIRKGADFLKLVTPALELLKWIVGS